MSVLIAVSLVSLLTNYRVFASDLELATSEDIGIPQAFLYAGSHVQKLADVGVRVTANRTHTFVNFTDKAPRVQPYNVSFKAYRDFLADQMNLSYALDFNASVPANQSFFTITGMNAAYNYSDFAKNNISVLQKDTSANFITRYEVFVVPLTSGVSAANISTISETSGNMTLHISVLNRTFTSSVSRTGTSVYMINFTGSANTVNITVGRVFGFNSSLRVDPVEKIWVNTTVMAKTKDIPKS